MNILIIENPKKKIAQWRATEMHLKYIKECEYSINIIVPKKYVSDLIESWSNSFQPDRIISFNNKFHLAQILIKLKNQDFFCITSIEVLWINFLSPFTIKNTIYWVQGIIPEEDYLRTKSKFRKLYIGLAEQFALRLAKKHILVSQYMKVYLEQSRKLTIKKYVIIPCTSDLTIKNVERIKDSYVYIGGLSAWQKMDRILMIYKDIATENPESKLFLYTFDTIKMNKLVAKYIPNNIKNNISIGTLENRNEIATVLSSMEYGFLIRDNDPINNVSSPIKLAEYLSCGVNVILSNSVSSYASIVENAGCGVIIYDDNDIHKLNTFQSSAEKAIDLYNNIFNYKSTLDRYKRFLN